MNPQVEKSSRFKMMLCCLLLQGNLPNSYSGTLGFRKTLHQKERNQMGNSHQYFLQVSKKNLFPSAVMLFNPHQIKNLCKCCPRVFLVPSIKLIFQSKNGQKSFKAFHLVPSCVSYLFLLGVFSLLLNKITKIHLQMRFDKCGLT